MTENRTSGEYTASYRSRINALGETALRLADTAKRRTLPARYRLADFILPEGREQRRSLARLQNIDKLTGLPNQDAFDLALPAANADSETEFGLLDGTGLTDINNHVSYRAGSALIKAYAICAKAAVKSLGPERLFRLGGDELVYLTSPGRASVIASIARQNLAERISTGEPFEYLPGELFPLELYEGFDLGFHFGCGQTFEEADRMLQDDKTRYHQKDV